MALIGLGVCIWGSFDARRDRDDPGYAERFFQDLVEVDEVLQSRMWHGPGAEPWDCSYAIVRCASKGRGDI
ncbi:MAG: hypothetical protein MK098_01695 [Marinovum sp.]|nr:hypothetical protein [Marinovum sp.]